MATSLPAPEPHPPAATNFPVVDGAVDGETSITHYEYLRAVQRKLPVMAFLLDEHYPWPPQFIDGFDKTRAQAPTNAEKIRALRQCCSRNGSCRGSPRRPTWKRV